MAALAWVDASSAGLVLRGAERAVWGGASWAPGLRELNSGKGLSLSGFSLRAVPGPEDIPENLRTFLSPFEPTEGRDSFLLGVPGPGRGHAPGMSARSDSRDLGRVHNQLQSRGM